MARLSFRFRAPGLSMLAAVLAAGVAPPAQAAPQLANPASQHCVAQGGTVSIEASPQGGQYGVCLFDDNRQCEEWAMLRGECPTGGIKVTGYATPAARYCAITGGTYTVTGASGTPDERGTCTLPGGRECTALSHYEGSCTQQASSPGAAAGAAGAPQRIQAAFSCAGGKSIDSTFFNGDDSRVRLALSDGRAMTLPQAMSADGGRYASKDESVVFWNKGRTAFLQENGERTYADCVAR